MDEHDGWIPISQVDPQTIDHARRGLVELRNVSGLLDVRAAVLTVIRRSGTQTL